MRACWQKEEKAGEACHAKYQAPGGSDGRVRGSPIKSEARGEAMALAIIIVVAVIAAAIIGYALHRRNQKKHTGELKGRLIKRSTDADAC